MTIEGSDGALGASGGRDPGSDSEAWADRPGAEGRAWQLPPSTSGSLGWFSGVSTLLLVPPFLRSIFFLSANQDQLSHGLSWESFAHSFVLSHLVSTWQKSRTGLYLRTHMQRRGQAAGRPGWWELWSCLEKQKKMAGFVQRGDQLVLSPRNGQDPAHVFSVSASSAHP